MPNKLLDYLESTAARVPDRVAFFNEERVQTYADLADASRKIGSGLAEKLPVHGIAALLLDSRSLDYPAMMLGTLQAGCTYAPLDPAMPAERLSLILDRLRPDAVAADEKGRKALTALREQPAPVLAVKDLLGASADGTELSRRRALSAEDDAVSILYTSGSTGIPKGSVQTVGSYVGYTEATVVVYGFSENTVFANQSPFFYANSIIDLYPPLMLGASVYLVPAGSLSFPQRFIDCLRKHHVTELTMTPTSFAGIANSGVLTPESLPELRWGIMSGERMNRQPLDCWMKAAPDAGFWNFYGSTEAFSVAVGRVPESGKEAEPLTVGKPFDAVRILFTDEDGNPVSPEQGGEMSVASPWISRGYYRDPERTAQSWFRDTDGIRRYRTGDIGRITPDGELLVIGRKDGQVKHHGYRMELAEAEQAAASVPGWQEGCILFDRETGEMACFWTGGLTEKELRDALRKKLQRYMLPDCWFHLETMPHTATMKADRTALRLLWEERNAAG